MSIFGAPAKVVGAASFPPTPSPTPPFNTAVGDVIIVFACYGNGTTGMACTDAAGNEYEPVGAPVLSPGGILCQMWTCVATEAMVGNTVSVGGTTGSEMRGALVWDFPVTGGVAVLDVVASKTITPASVLMATDPVDLSGNDEVVVVGAENDGGDPVTVQSGFTEDYPFAGVFTGTHGAFASPQSGFVAEVSNQWGAQTGVVIAAAFMAVVAAKPKPVARFIQ
jgi:hypothetical protein